MTNIELPKGINETDITSPKKYDALVEDWDKRQFEMWYTERFGWCIPTLMISRASSRARSAGATTDRSYAISVKDERLVTIGRGPHVKRTVTVYVRKTRAEALQKFLDLRDKGSEQANDYRDQLSTKRLRSRGRGMFGLY